MSPRSSAFCRGEPSKKRTATATLRRSVRAGYGPHMSDDALRQVLAHHGYLLRYHEHTWTECLITGQGESYAGRGLDREQALADALGRLCPSRLARSLLDAAVRVESDVALDEESTPVEPFRCEGGRIDRGRIPPAAPARPLPLATRAPSPRALDHGGALDELSILADRVEECRVELAWSTAPRQRLAILAWICEARSHTDVFPEDQEVREAVARVSRQLTEIGKAYWPGSVTALQLQMQPSDLPRHLLGETPATWARAAELAERALDQLEQADERRGQDPYGWGDYGALSPEPVEPQAILRGLVDAVETSWGPLDRYAEPRNPEDLPDPPLYQQWVRELRWVRGQDVDPDAWARVMGRLRWWSCRRNGPVQVEGRELEPGFRPERPWANLLEREGRDCPGFHLPDAMLRRVRDRFADKRLLVVGRRRDPVEQGELTEALPEARFEWRILEPDLLETLPSVIEEAGYDAVLSAVGLQVPSADIALARACRKAGVFYARAHRGQPVACIRGLARLAASA